MRGPATATGIRTAGDQAFDCDRKLGCVTPLFCAVEPRVHCTLVLRFHERSLAEIMSVTTNTIVIITGDGNPAHLILQSIHQGLESVKGGRHPIFPWTGAQGHSCVWVSWCERRNLNPWGEGSGFVCVCAPRYRGYYITLCFGVPRGCGLGDVEVHVYDESLFWCRSRRRGVNLEMWPTRNGEKVLL
jgi:hypothetical protein